MDINITDDKLQEIIEKEVRNCVHQKIVNVMNDGCASWFTQQNIQRITYDVVLGKVTQDVAKEAIKKVDEHELMTKLSECLARQLINKLEL